MKGHAKTQRNENKYFANLASLRDKEMKINTLRTWRLCVTQKI